MTVTQALISMLCCLQLMLMLPRPSFAQGDGESVVPAAKPTHEEIMKRIDRSNAKAFNRNLTRQYPKFAQTCHDAMDQAADRYEIDRQEYFEANQAYYTDCIRYYIYEPKL